MLTQLVFILIFIVFYFILSGGGRVGRIPRVATKGSCRDAAQEAREAAPWGHSRWQPLSNHILGCYLESEARQCSLSHTLRPAHGVMSLSCLALCWKTSDWVFEEVGWRE